MGRHGALQAPAAHPRILTACCPRQLGGCTASQLLLAPYAGSSPTLPGPSQMLSPAATDALPLTSRSGTTGSNAPSFTAQGAALFMPAGATANSGGAALAGAAGVGAGSMHPMLRGASATGLLPPGLQAAPGVGSYVGSFASDSTLAAGGWGEGGGAGWGRRGAAWPHSASCGGSGLEAALPAPKRKQP